ncbi:hypothetical protein CTRI78_v000687 [Colletotrichum trifolii]|uniref:Uncharacterized protein n=1 Tax=Colletotrichum trifolii TaxID=5466 RepID=A0A4R8S0J0_COLTR|nr:hypothetical protein CTRI78_v000687 [Colletotrichum trifolii]
MQKLKRRTKWEAWFKREADLQTMAGSSTSLILCSPARRDTEQSTGPRHHLQLTRHVSLSPPYIVESWTANPVPHSLPALARVPDVS